MLDSTRSRRHGPSEPCSLEWTHINAWRAPSLHTLLYPPVGRDPPIHSKRHLGASPFHRSGCLGPDTSRIGGVLQAILWRARPFRVGLRRPFLHRRGLQGLGTSNRPPSHLSPSLTAGTITPRSAR